MAHSAVETFKNLVRAGLHFVLPNFLERVADDIVSTNPEELFRIIIQAFETGKDNVQRAAAVALTTLSELHPQIVDERVLRKADKPELVLKIVDSLIKLIISDKLSMADVYELLVPMIQHIASAKAITTEICEDLLGLLNHLLSKEQDARPVIESFFEISKLQPDILHSTIFGLSATLLSMTKDDFVVQDKSESLLSDYLERLSKVFSNLSSSVKNVRIIKDGKTPADIHTWQESTIQNLKESIKISSS